ncbi:MAG: hypothetical protein ACHQQ3_02240, partial [Gemmatimonadales bacterium]
MSDRHARSRKASGEAAVHEAEPDLDASLAPSSDADAPATPVAEAAEQAAMVASALAAQLDEQKDKYL